MVRNVLQNSAKFTNAHGHVAVSVTQRGPAHAAIRITDDGIGIDPEVLPSIFEPFTQADESLARSFGGGLGLALVKALVEMHGGHVEAKSAGLGRGTEITISLPLMSEANTELQAAEVANIASSGSVASRPAPPSSSA